MALVQNYRVLVLKNPTAQDCTSSNLTPFPSPPFESPFYLSIFDFYILNRKWYDMHMLECAWSEKERKNQLVLHHQVAKKPTDALVIEKMSGDTKRWFRRFMHCQQIESNLLKKYTLHLGVQCTVLFIEVDKGSSSLYWLPAIFWNNFRRARIQHFHTFKTQNGKPTYVFQMPIYF